MSNEPEKQVGRHLEWQDPRRGLQRLTVLLKGDRQRTIIIKHDDQQSGAKRIPVLPTQADALRALLDDALNQIEKEHDDRRALFEDEVD